MQYLALACDYDGTLATHGVVDDQTLSRLEEWVAAGRQLLMVTGRELPELQSVFPHLSLFHAVVAENGGLLYVPATGETRPLAPPPSADFLQRLYDRGVGPISVGQSIIATWEPHEATVLETIRELGLELQVIFNKGAVMILPSGVNKATGLASALRGLKISRHQVVAIGDAENDHAFLQFSRLGVAVSNALPALKERAELVTEGDHGRGVQELIGHLMKGELSDVRPQRHGVVLSEHGSEQQLWHPGEEHVLVNGSPEGARLAIGELANALIERGYQFCWFCCDSSALTAAAAPERDEGRIVHVGGAEQLPTPDEIMQNLSNPETNVKALFCTGGDGQRRQAWTEILGRLKALRSQQMRPHVVIVSSLTALDKYYYEQLQGFTSIVSTTPEQHRLPDVMNSRNTHLLATAR